MAHPRHGRSLRNQLVMLVLGLVIPLLALQGWWSAHDYRAARESAEQNALAVADAVSLGVVQFFSQAEELLTATTERLGTTVLAEGSCSEQVRIVTELYPFLYNAVAVGADGRVICSSRTAPVGASAREWPWFEGVSANPVFTIGSPVEADFTAGWVLPLVAPLTDEHGRFAGALVGTVALVELSRLVGGVSIPDDHLVTVATADRVIVARSAEAEARVGSALPPLTGSDRAVGTGRWVAKGPDLEGTPRTWGQIQIDPGWIVYVGVPDAVVFGPARREALLHVGASLVIMLLGMLFAGQSYSRIAASLRQLAERTRLATEGETVPLPPDMPVEVTEVVEQFNDALSARHRAEAAERAARERFESLFENAVVGLYVSTGDGRFLQVNQALVDMLGYETAADLLQVGPSHLYADPRQREKLIERSITSGRAPVEELEWIRADGVPITVRLGGKLIAGPDGEPVFEMIVQDVTEEKRTEDELRQTQKMEAIGQLAGGIAHDFNNLLTVIGGNVELLEDELSASPQARADLDQIARATRRATGLTRRLLTFSRKQRGGSQVVQVNEAVSGLSRMLVPILGEQIVLEVDLAPEGAAVEIDPGELEQVVLNLVLNARDALPRGGHVRITTGVTEGGPGASNSSARGVWLRVQDDGVGMDAPTRARIFEPFYTTKPMGEGTGLGLSTVYGIVKRAGGSVDVESQPGAGTTMTVHLRAARLDADQGDDPRADGTTGSGEWILVVEDDELVRRFVVRALREAGYEVRSASSGDGALQILRAEALPLDLVLTDVVMPGLNGQELAERLALTHPETPVLFMSGYVDDRHLTEAFWDRPETLLRKPFTTGQLRTSVRELLDRRKAPLVRD
jgi:PAS domain S-box-containing protein